MLIYLCIYTYLYLYLTPGNSERQGSLTCCSSWGRKESDTTPHPTTPFHPGNQTLSLTSPALAGRFFNTSTTWEAPSVLTMDYYSATKRNNWLQHGWTLKTCFAKTARHRQSHIIWSLCYGLSRVGKSTEMESRFAVAKSWERRLGICFGEDENVLESVLKVVTVLLLFVVQSLSHVGPLATSIRLLCLRDSPGKNTGVGYHFPLKGIFLTQGSNPCLLHRQADSLPLSH